MNFYFSDNFSFSIVLNFIVNVVQNPLKISFLEKRHSLTYEQRYDQNNLIIDLITRISIMR